ncbi:hypothetical protein U9M48_044538 [Paspalum notatum var. saurae]|uniref:Uncharacterized protein n=1 Tax=Paspalum notatum var. saurae TaxID=547442 RepID=A0AAQ3UVA7_PASNO
MTSLMSSFKRGARMRVGGRIGRLDKTRLPTPTPPSPPPQEWEDTNDTEEEDPEELVPDSSDIEELEVQPEVPPLVPKDQAAAQGQDGGQAQQQQNENEDGTRASTVGSTTHRRFLGCCGKR